jgi:hypothetical protein
MRNKLFTSVEKKNPKKVKRAEETERWKKSEGGYEASHRNARGKDDG